MPRLCFAGVALVAPAKRFLQPFSCALALAENGVGSILPSLKGGVENSRCQAITQRPPSRNFEALTAEDLDAAGAGSSSPDAATAS